MKRYITFFLLASVLCSTAFSQDALKDKRGNHLSDLKKSYFEGKYKDAVMVYLNFGEPLSAEEAYYLGMSNFSLYNYEAALEYFKEAVEKDKGNTGYEYQLAKTYLLTGKTTLAEKHFADILTREPNNVPVLFDAGSLDYSQKRYTGAVKKFKKVIAAAPANFLAYFNLAKSYAGLEPQPAYSDSVIINLSACITINKEYLPGIEMLATLHFNKKSYEHARILFSTASYLNPARSDFPYLEGLCFEKEGEYDKAVELYNEAIKINPKEPHYHDHLGFSNYNLKKYSEAIANYKKAVELEEDNASYNVNLGYAYVQTDSIKEAVESFRTAVTKLRPETIGLVYYQIGNVYYKKQNYKDAKQAYQTALFYDPVNIDAHYLGAISDEELKNKKAALAGYKKAFELIKDTMPEGELSGDERYNTIKKRIADLSKRIKKELK